MSATVEQNVDLLIKRLLLKVCRVTMYTVSHLHSIVLRRARRGVR
jgi:hypothetical protein